MEKRMDNIDLTPKQHSEVKALLKRHLPNVEVWAYGSRVTFKTRHNSDLDLVAFADKERRSALHDLREAFEESYLPFAVDLLAWSDIPERFKPNIRRAYYVLQKKTEKEIPEGWKIFKLEDLGFFIGGVSSIKRSDYGYGTPFLPYKQVYKNSKVDVSNLELMNVKKSELERRNCIWGDIFFTASSETADEVAISSVLLDEVENLTFNGFCKRYRLHNFDTLRPEYARYLFRERKFRGAVYGKVTGDTRFNISQKSLADISIAIPDIARQKAIARILEMLDDKIEGNQKVNKDLEETAKTIFQLWFVDFAPVRAKMEGRPTGLSPEISALFPEKLTKSKIGEIPQGWELLPGQALYEHQKGLSYKGKFLSENPDDIPMLGLGSFAGGGGYRKEKLKFYNGEHKEWHKIRPDDLLIANTDLTQDRAIIGSPIIVPQSPNKSEYYLHTHHTTKITPKNDSPVSKVYLYYNFLQPAFRGRAAGFAIGTTVLALPKDTFESLLILVPPKPLLEKFEAIAQPIVKRLSRSSQEEDVLIELRDTLLPMLISGELQIKNVKKIIEQTGI